jgi:hypothetical protein
MSYPEMDASHATAALLHLQQAHDATNAEDERYHLTAAGIRATLANAEAAQRQSNILAETQEIHRELLGLMRQPMPPQEQAATPALEGGEQA